MLHALSDAMLVCHTLGDIVRHYGMLRTAVYAICISNSMVSSVVWGKKCMRPFFKVHQNNKSPKDECYWIR